MIELTNDIEMIIVSTDSLSETNADYVRAYLSELDDFIGFTGDEKDCVLLQRGAYDVVASLAKEYGDGIGVVSVKDPHGTPEFSSLIDGNEASANLVENMYTYQSLNKRAFSRQSVRVDKKDVLDRTLETRVEETPQLDMTDYDYYPHSDKISSKLIDDLVRSIIPSKEDVEKALSDPLDVMISDHPEMKPFVDQYETMFSSLRKIMSDVLKNEDLVDVEKTRQIAIDMIKSGDIKDAEEYISLINEKRLIERRAEDEYEQASRDYEELLEDEINRVTQEYAEMYESSNPRPTREDFLSGQRNRLDEIENKTKSTTSRVREELFKVLSTDGESSALQKFVEFMSMRSSLESVLRATEERLSSQNTHEIEESRGKTSVDTQPDDRLSEIHSFDEVVAFTDANDEDRHKTHSYDTEDIMSLLEEETSENEHISTDILNDERNDVDDESDLDVDDLEDDFEDFDEIEPGEWDDDEDDEYAPQHSQDNSAEEKSDDHSFSSPSHSIEQTRSSRKKAKSIDSSEFGDAVADVENKSQDEKCKKLSTRSIVLISFSAVVVFIFSVLGVFAILGDDGNDSSTTKTDSSQVEKDKSVEKLQSYFKIGDKLEVQVKEGIISVKIVAFIDEGAVTEDSSGHQWLIDNKTLAKWLESHKDEISEPDEDLEDEQEDETEDSPENTEDKAGTNPSVTDVDDSPEDKAA